MKAIQVSRYGDAKVLEYRDIPIPKATEGQALVRIMAAGINYIDVYQRSGRYPVKQLPFTPGLEAAGVVESVGDQVRVVKKGDRVAYTGCLGSYAEYNAVPAEELIPLPDDLSFEQGAAFPLQGMTAEYLLHEFFAVQRGDFVLVHAAAGGVGLLLVQWLKHLGAKVIGTVSSEEKASLARAAGAHFTINYTKKDFADETKQITEGKGVRVIIDGVGKSTFAKNFEAIAFRGHIVIFGQSSGPADPVAPNLLQQKCVSMHGGTLFPFVRTRPLLLKRADTVIGGMREGWLRMEIHHRLPMQEAAEAHRMLEQRETTGKVILVNDR